MVRSRSYTSSGGTVDTSDSSNKSDQSSGSQKQSISTDAVEKSYPLEVSLSRNVSAPLAPQLDLAQLQSYANQEEMKRSSTEPVGSDSDETKRAPQEIEVVADLNSPKLRNLHNASSRETTQEESTSSPTRKANAPQEASTVRKGGGALPFLRKRSKSQRQSSTKSAPEVNKVIPSFAPKTIRNQRSDTSLLSGEASLPQKASSQTSLASKQTSEKAADSKPEDIPSEIQTVQSQERRTVSVANVLDTQSTVEATLNEGDATTRDASSTDESHQTFVLLSQEADEESKSSAEDRVVEYLTPEEAERLQNEIKRLEAILQLEDLSFTIDTITEEGSRSGSGMDSSMYTVTNKQRNFLSTLHSLCNCDDANFFSETSSVSTPINAKFFDDALNDFVPSIFGGTHKDDPPVVVQYGSTEQDDISVLGAFQTK